MAGIAITRTDLSAEALRAASCKAPSTPAARRMLALALVAEAVGLDLVATGWTPTVATYLGRVTKAQILDAVREARGEAAVQLVDHLKKADMAREAERLLAGTGWLPEPLRRPAVAAGVSEALPAFLVDDEAADEGGADPDAYGIAAE